MSKSGTIIIVDDNKGVLTAIQILLEEFYKLKYCSTVVYMVPRA